ncbi:hypothetical protein BBBF_1625 [Bifidobacterium bifidum ATCC 29521 = JCM 1255 = DSM 20456]|uniref:Uncharacterized protein n=1 Tax=Bifidobacterium bifidum ATCC 29521 = JCM 1255 = DSM 20456 TaxID=500634 RepID=A0ABM7ESX6_BIFBI|nr:hypothetical protein BBBF_1625 [Bifidobacterium bifidum ATCC 29521 = JCM 1255 = DSM 20456]
MTAENRRHTVNMATAEAIPPSWLSETCHRKTKETDALDAAAGAEPVLTGVTIGIRMTAGPILTNPGAPDISSEFLEAAGGSNAHSFRSTSGRNATHGRPRESSTISMPFHGKFSMVYGFGMSPSASHQAFSTASLPAHFAAKWVDSSSFLRLARSPACLTSRTENSPRMREPGSASCSANAETSTTSCPRPRTDIPRHLSERPVPVYDGSGPLCVLKCAPKRQVCALKDANGLVCVAMCADTSFRRALTNAKWAHTRKRAGPSFSSQT